MNDIAISLKNVSKYYKLYNSPQDRLKESLSFSDKEYHKKFYATKNLNLEIKKGEIIGIVGKNGSGKSTLLKLITGVLTPNEGSIQVNGKISALLELGSGFNPEFTGMQNIFFYGTILGFSKKEMEEKLDDILAFADIGEFIDQPLKTYSSGMKSRLGFAVAVHIDPEILILDEVLAVGDILFKRKCYAKMEEFFKGGKTILYVSHDANSVNELCTRAIFLNDSNILLDDDAKTVTAFYQKYLFSNKETKKQIIDDLRQQSTQKNTKEPQKNIAKTELKTATKRKKTHSENNIYFAEGLQSESLQKVQNHQVDIFDPKILNSDGEQVNMLIIDKTYYLTFIIKTPILIKQVSYGAQIKGLKGDIIANASLKNANLLIDEMSKGEYKITWSFVCKLLPGTYLIDTSSTGIVYYEREVLCRVFDHLMFKVLGQSDLLYQGTVKLDQELHYEKIN
ncbi:ABC transporter ATP-binding protein [Sulfurovum sp. CS9]|uniref:ABC transporter ATP-binding protein n=1 Tax=Sulfurovum sp. CS9 TaxID=3391146 RepID=UPI0039E97822